MAMIQTYAYVNQTSIKLRIFLLLKVDNQYFFKFLPLKLYLYFQEVLSRETQLLAKVAQCSQVELEG